MEGYVLHSYGPECYAQHVVASVMTLRRHDPDRPIALYCSEEHRTLLERYGLDTLFAHLDVLPEAHRSIVGFKHHLHQFMPFERSLFIDADMVWCRDPDPLWRQLSGFSFTATGRERADVYFGAPKGFGIVFDYVLNRRRRTLERFGLTHMSRVQAGMIYSQDRAETARVCETATAFLERRRETHFRSRLDEGRSEESCEWSLAMAMSRLRLSVFPQYQGFNSPQLDYVEGYAQFDPDFHHVLCRYHPDSVIHDLRGIPSAFWRGFFYHLFAHLPARSDYMDVTPFALHFGWLKHKKPFHDFSERTWQTLTRQQAIVSEGA